MNRRIRAQGNLVEYAPVILVMMGALELSEQPPAALHALRNSIRSGKSDARLRSFQTIGQHYRPRWRMLLTLTTLAVASLLCIWAYLA